MQRSQVNFDRDWSVRVGELGRPPRRVVAKATTANGVANLQRDEIPTTAAPNVIEAFGANFQAVVVTPETLDEKWQSVALPHDWRITQEQAPDHPERADYPRVWQGYYPSGLAYYRKTFSRPLPAAEERVELTFDGVATYSDYWINGFWLGSHPTGYSPVTFDITEFLRAPEDGPNVVLVRADSTEPEGWWYEGGGIYRHVWLTTHHAVHVAGDGIYITTPTVHRDRADLCIAVEVRNDSARQVQADVGVRILDATGREVTLAALTAVTVPSIGTRTADLTAQIPSPALWDIGQGNLYTAVVTVQVDGDEVDETTQVFGVRTIDWATDGLRINGRLQKVYGVNIHQDFAGVGVALPDRIIEAKLELLVEMGVNAVRSAHHPATPELVQHADRLGLLVMPENRALSTAPVHIQLAVAHIRRFRNNPSILMWGLENEELNLEGNRLGRTLLSRMVAITKTLDPTRATTVGGLMGLDDAEFYGQVDVVGMHYQGVFGNLEAALSTLPDRPHIEDEEGLFASSRGVYEKDAIQRPTAFFTLADMGLPDALAVANGGSDIAQVLHDVFTHPKLAGALIWTGIDYLGEPTGAWPVVSASYGARDLIGIPKDFYWLLRSLFRPEPLVHAFPHWSWPGREGDTLPFRIYTNCDEIEVVVNNEFVARQTVVGAAARFPGGIVYTAGEIVVRGYKDGVQVAEHRQQTAGQPAKLFLSADRDLLAADGADVAIIRVAITDDAGLLVPHAAVPLKFDLVGAGRIMGVGNGDPASVEPQQSHTPTTFNGYAAALIQGGDEPGRLTVRVTAPGLPAARLDLTLSTEIRPHQIHFAADEAVGSAGGHWVAELTTVAAGTPA